MLHFIFTASFEASEKKTQYFLEVWSLYALLIGHKTACEGWQVITQPKLSMARPDIGGPNNITRVHHGQFKFII